MKETFLEVKVKTKTGSFDIEAGVRRIGDDLLVAIWGGEKPHICLLYTSPSPRDRQKARMPSSA